MKCLSARPMGGYTLKFLKKLLKKHWAPDSNQELMLESGVIVKRRREHQWAGLTQQLNLCLFVFEGLSQVIEITHTEHFYSPCTPTTQTQVRKVQDKQCCKSGAITWNIVSTSGFHFFVKLHKNLTLTASGAHLYKRFSDYILVFPLGLFHTGGCYTTRK